MEIDKHWYELLTDASETDYDASPIPSYSAAAEIGDTDHFRSPRYPYSDRLGLREYFQTKQALQIELVKLQNWTKEQGAKLLCLFEGRDAAGKGSAIRCFTEHLNPRGARVVALDKPSERESSQWYFQRYVNQLPAAGEMVFFDRSWYNRAGVERVMGFCSEAQYWQFVQQVTHFEQMLVDTGMLMFKFYLSVSKEEQARRIADRATNPLKQWKLSPIDVEAQTRWDAYTDAKEETFRLTDTPKSPWLIIKSDDKLRARLQAMRVVLRSVDYTDRSLEAIGEVDPALVAHAGRIYRRDAPAGALSDRGRTDRPGAD